MVFLRFYDGKHDIITKPEKSLGESTTRDTGEAKTNDTMKYTV